jgi:hypothetical protein
MPKKPKKKPRTRGAASPPEGADFLERAFGRAALPVPNELSSCLTEFEALAESLAQGHFELAELPGREQIRERVAGYFERIFHEDVRKAVLRAVVQELEDPREAEEVLQMIDPWLEGTDPPQLNPVPAAFVELWSRQLDPRLQAWLPLWFELEKPARPAADEAFLAPAMDWVEPIRTRLIAHCREKTKT